MVIYENMKVIASSIEEYGNMQLIKKQRCSTIPCKSQTGSYYGHCMEKHARLFPKFDKVYWAKTWIKTLIENITLKREVQQFWH